MEGVDFALRQPNTYIADACGLGKTAQALIAAARRGCERVAVATTASSVDNWHAERVKWTGKTFKQFAVLSYAASKLHGGQCVGSDWDAVILDEAHYVKNRMAKRSKAALAFARTAPSVICLSATPMPNHPGEMFAPVAALWPHLLKPDYSSYDRWLRYFCKFTTHPQYGPRVYGVQNVPEFRTLVRQFMLRRRLEDVALDLPPLRLTVHMLPFDSGFVKHLEAAGVDWEDLEHRMEAEEKTDNPSLSRLRRLLGEYKAPRIADVVAQELEDGQYAKIVVVYYHTAAGDRLQARLGEFGLVRMDGSTPRDRRQGLVDQFTNDRDIRVFLAQSRTAGEAINLQAASEMVIVEPPWTPDEVTQIVGRIRRIGQDHPCRARVFGVAGTSDAGVMQTLVRKANMKREVQG